MVASGNGDLRSLRTSFVTNIVLSRAMPAGVAQASDPPSRRDRPGKPPLSRAAIVETALMLVQQDGLDAVTLRNVAQRLDTGPASLYVYVANRDELLERVLDQVLSEVSAVRVESRRWQARLVESFSGCLAALDR